MIYRTLGRTGEKVSAIGLGGHHIGVEDKVSEEMSLQLIRSAIDRGITFMDNSWDYHNGVSEVRMGRALKDGYRNKVFLMSKIDGRSKKEAKRQLDESLLRLQVDTIDLVQHHEVIRFDDPHRMFDKEGANEALLEAREQGKIRFIGFTGHKDPHIHLHTLNVAREAGFQFDTVQMPLNVFDAHYRSFEQVVLPELVNQNIGVLGMKSMGAGVILKAKVASAEECLRYALSLPTSVVITGIDSMEVLEQACRVTADFQPLSDEEKKELLARTAKAASHGTFEQFKTTSVHDSTAQHPEWLGEESEQVQELSV